MTDKVITNNQVTLIGRIISEFEFSHEIFGEGFYNVMVEVPRLSEHYDTLTIQISERMINVKESMIDAWVKITGQFRSYNKHEDTKNRLVLSVFARDIEFLEEEPEVADNQVNDIYLEGFLCKEPIYRKTPLGREISDLLLAVNRPYGKSDYIPCICWGRNARYTSQLAIGQRIMVRGRIQSREYMKKLDDEHVERRVAYEVSVMKIEELPDDKEAEQE